MRKLAEYWIPYSYSDIQNGTTIPTHVVGASGISGNAFSRLVCEDRVG